MIVAGKIGYGKMALSIYRIIDIKVLMSKDTAITINHHEVAAPAVPSDPRSDRSASVYFTLHRLKTGLPAHYADKIVGTSEGLVEIPGHIACRWDGGVAAVAMIKLSICNTALRPRTPPPIEMGYARCSGRPAPVGLGLHLHVECELLR